MSVGLGVKAVNMALQATGKRNSKLRAAAVRTAEQLANSELDSASWIGRDVLKELARKPPRKAGAR